MVRSTLLVLFPLTFSLESITLAENSFRRGSTRKCVLTCCARVFLIKYLESEALGFEQFRYKIDLKAILFSAPAVTRRAYIPQIAMLEE